jgi:hypothetical protein
VLIGETSSIREEELKNRVAALFFGKYDCTRIVGNIDFCVMVKRHECRFSEGRPHVGEAAFSPLHESHLYWAEAKNHPTDIYRMLAQLILTIGRAGRPRPADAARPEAAPYHMDEPPKFVGCFDNEKIAFVEYHHILPVFNLNDFNWTQTPSAVDDKTVETVRRTIPAEKIVEFRFGADDSEIKAFIARNFASCESPALATPIDRNNFTFIYQKWRSEVMPHIDAPWDVLKKKYALYDRDFFLAEMNVDDNGTPELSDDRPAEDFYITFDANAREPYTIRRKNEDELNFNLTFGFKPGGLDAYAAFWRRYKRPPKREYWDFIVSRLDLLVPQDVRERKGAFFTPQMWVQLSQQRLADVLGENWQDEYYVWDCAGGTGNLEVGLTNKYRVWVSTLDQQDVDVMHQRIANGATLLDSHVFQFDFLNDSFDKLPSELKKIIDDPAERRKLVVYFNPPYAEVSTIGGGKKAVNQSFIHDKYAALLGTAGRELYAQFLIRIHEEIPGCIIGHFSTLKHLQGSAFDKFRQNFRAELKSLCVVPANTFDNVKGEFPIGFFVWDTSVKVSFTEIVADVFDKAGEPVGQKNVSANVGVPLMTEWVAREFPLKPVGEPIGFLAKTNSNDFQNNNIICILNKREQLPNPRGRWIDTSSLPISTVYFAVRKCIDATWLNDRDQFLMPDDRWRNDSGFVSDCLVYTLFHGQNRISTQHGVNHWIPFTETEVDAKERFASHFMSDFINGRAGRSRPDAARPEAAPYQADLFAESSTGGSRFCATAAETAAHHAGATSCAPPTSVPLCLCVKENLSPAARAVLDAGRELWRYYHAQPGANPNASYYDIRAHFQGCKPNGTMNTTSADVTYSALLVNLRSAHKALAAQIEPKVYEYGFLKR